MKNEWNNWFDIKSPNSNRIHYIIRKQIGSNANFRLIFISFNR